MFVALCYCKTLINTSEVVITITWLI